MKLFFPTQTILQVRDIVEQENLKKAMKNRYFIKPNENTYENIDKALCVSCGDVDKAAAVMLEEDVNDVFELHLKEIIYRAGCPTVYLTI